MTTVDIDSLLAQDEVRVLLETSEHAGTIRIQDLADLVETHELAPLEHDALLRELDKRGIEVVDPPPAPEPPPLARRPARDDDGRAAALPARGRPAHAADRCAGGRAREARRARRPRCEAGDDPVQPPPGRLDREELPQPGAPLPRPDPGRHPRPHSRRREVRLAPRLQVLDLCDLVDPAGRRQGARRQGAHDPDAGPHRRAAAEDEPRRAVALDRARTGADAGRDRRRGEPDAAAGARGAGRGPRVEQPRRADRRGRGRGSRRLRRGRRDAARGDASSWSCAARPCRRPSPHSPSASSRS